MTDIEINIELDIESAKDIDPNDPAKTRAITDDILDGLVATINERWDYQDFTAWEWWNDDYGTGRITVRHEQLDDKWEPPYRRAMTLVNDLSRLPGIEATAGPKTYGTNGLVGEPIADYLAEIFTDGDVNEDGEYGIELGVSTPDDATDWEAVRERVNQRNERLVEREDEP